MLSTVFSQIIGSVKPRSLVMRLLLAQIVMIALLCALLGSLLAWQIAHEEQANETKILAEAAAVMINVTSAAMDKPEQLKALLAQFDRYHQTLVTTVKNVEAFTPRSYFWIDGNLIHLSVAADPAFTPSKIGIAYFEKIERYAAQVYAQQSPDGRVRVALLIPASSGAAGFDPFSPSWYLIPLLLSLPLLTIPAWWSVKLALRPWEQLSAEIAIRKPGELNSLQFRSTLKELVPLTIAVDGLLDRLKKTRVREQTFIAYAAHELRTPIAAMRINAEALCARGLTPTDQDLLRGLLRSNDRAGRLVEQLLTLLRSESSDELRNVRSIDITRLLQDCLAQLSPLASRLRIELDLRVDDGLHLQGDEESLRALFDNIIANAIKYSSLANLPDQTPARQVLVSAQTIANLVTITVTDEGPGIAPEQRDLVFNRFYRPAGQLQSGSGLGLAIAKSVADRHNARIELQTPAGGTGLIVIVTFLNSLK